jgi:membrane-bound lytic murein transglycosylase A
MTKQLGTITVVKKSIKIVGKISVFCSFFAIAHAANYCAKDVASTTTYFTPDIKDYCKNGKICKAFQDEVVMQGSGKLPGNKVYRFVRMVNKQPVFKIETEKPGCYRGSANTCLLPFISVAADPKYYDAGDIIEMPALKGRVITLPNGKTMVHPGYMIVSDVGGYIKGPNRFDFYTGAYGVWEKKNPFGYKGPMSLRATDKKLCNKPFSVVRRDDLNYGKTLAAIEGAVDSARPITAIAQTGYAGIESNVSRGGTR